MAIPTLDRRERALSAALGDYPHTMADLPVGDVTVCYEDGTRWVAERKLGGLKECRTWGRNTERGFHNALRSP